MLKHCRSFIVAVGVAVMAMASYASELFLFAVDRVSVELTPQKLEAELAQNVAHKVTDSRKPVSFGSGSGESALDFVSMLKAINSRSLSAAA
jgi:hypothetical protein